MKSSLYHGWVRHRRFGPTRNSFRYRLFMVYLDLAELDRVFARRWLWSTRRPALAFLKRSDYLAPHDVPIDTAVRDRVAAVTGRRPAGPVRMLSHLRYFGFCFNPVTFYYCFDVTDSSVEAVVAEIENTPWGERHAYVLPVTASSGPPSSRRWQFGKAFHVSPFLPMDMDYDWRFRDPDARLAVHMQNLRDGAVAFDATLNLERRPITGRSLALALAAYPLMTVQVVLLIYWQAFRLLLKRTPFFTHPDKLPPVATRAPGDAS